MFPENQCYCDSANTTGLTSNQKISAVETEGAGGHFCKPSSTSAMYRVPSSTTAIKAHPTELMGSTESNSKQEVQAQQNPVPL